MIINELKFLERAAKDFSNSGGGERVLELIRRGNPFDQFFFEKISDPDWLPFLKKSGLFTNLPLSEIRNDGAVTYPRSVVLRGLLNLSKVVPIDVIEILEGVVIPENPTIKDQLMGILAEIEEPTITDRILEVASRIIRNKPYVNLVWIEDVLAKAAGHEFYEGALEVVDSIFDVTLAATEEHPRSVDAWQIGEIDRNILVPISKAQPLPTARVVLKAFLKWVKIERARESASSNRFLDSVFESAPPLNEEDNPSSYWLEDFHGSVIGSHDLEATFAYRLFNIGTHILQSENQDDFETFDTLLRADPWNLFARLRWQLYADFPKATLIHARRDALSRIPNVGHYSGSHGYEMAQMLEKHSEMHGNSLLASDEVETLCKIVRSGPIDYENKLETESSFRETFHRKQLYPIRCLLKDADLDFFNSLFDGAAEIRQEAFKPFSSGEARMVENVPPKRALEMPAMSDTELWDFLNHWVPNPKRPDPEKWWVEEDVSALGVMFAELLESTPDRFPASTEWWKNLNKPSVLLKPLDRATNRISEATKGGTEASVVPSENDWRNWFGLASWITDQRTESPAVEDADEERVELEGRDWNWPSIVVVRFLTTALGSKFELPPDLLTETGRILRKLIEGRDARLENKEKPWMDDWQTTAINSVRGTAVDGLLDLSLFHKRHGGNPDPDGWIYDLIVSRLVKPDESPAVFAIFGSRLRLLLHLFSAQLKSQPELLLPIDRKERRNTLLLSHVRYDNPMTQVIDTLPAFPDAAIDCLTDMNSLQNTDQETRGDYGGRLGIHLGFYYWNNSFADQSTADDVMDHYFATAKPSHRSRFIRDIARIFEKSPDTEEMRPLHQLVCRLWDRRFERIEQDLTTQKLLSPDVDDELAASIDLLGCECFPFDWRHSRVLAAIKLLKKAPHAGFIIKTLEGISSDPDRLHAALEILEALMSKDTAEIRWAYQEKNVRPMLQRGLASGTPETRNLAEHAQEGLLRHGLFEYLDLTVEPLNQS